MSALGLGSRAILGEMYLRLQMGDAGWVEKLSFEVDSDQASEEHKWLGMTPQMREWLGGRLINGLRESGIVITNVEYEATLSVLLSEIRRDKTKQVMVRIADLTRRANSHGAKLLSDLIIAGESTVCYDGQFYYDTDHSEGDSGTQSNDLSIDISALPVPVAEQGSTTAPGAKVMQQVILQCIQAILGFKDDQGEPLNEGATEFLTVVPTPLWTPAVTAAGNANLANGETNVLANMDGFKIAVKQNPRLTWTDAITVFRADDGDGVKPFIKQIEKPLEIAFQAEGSPEEFHNKRHVYGIDYSGAFGYGMWQHACFARML